MPLQSTLLLSWRAIFIFDFLIPLCFNLIAAINVLQLHTCDARFEHHLTVRVIPRIGILS